MADKAAAEGVTPLEVMLDAMRRHHKARRYDEAAAVAKDCAPYVHPRLSSVAHSGAVGVELEVVEVVVRTREEAKAALSAVAEAARVP